MQNAKKYDFNAVINRPFIQKIAREIKAVSHADVQKLIKSHHPAISVRSNTKKINVQ